MHRGQLLVAAIVASLLIIIASPIGLTSATSGGALVPTIGVYDFARNDYELGYVGSPLIISSFLFSDQIAPKPFVNIFEVKDSDNITQFIAWQSGTLLRDREQIASVSWIPEEPGLYSFRTVAISSFEYPELVQRPGYMALHVVEIDAGNRAYMLFHDGTEYVIEYSMDYGIISSVTADSELSTLKMQVERVTNDTDFTLKVPKTLLAELLRCGGEEPASLDHLPEPSGFADSIQVDPEVLDWGIESATLGSGWKAAQRNMS